MARPTVIRTETILDAARDVFLQQGPLGTTNEIAQRAGVSEGSIFKRFRSKAALFRAAMGVDDEPEALRHLAALAGTGAVVDNLAVAAQEIFTYVLKVIPLWHAAMASRREGEMAPQGFALRWGQQGLEDYLASEMALGRVRACDPALVTLAFTSTIVSPLTFQPFGVAATELDHAAYLAECVRIVWEAICPRTASAA